jgi:hypothetical protein
MPSTLLSKEMNQVSTLEILTQYPLTHITHSRVTQKATLLKSCMTFKVTSQGAIQQVYTPVSPRILACMQPCTAHIQRPFKLQPIFPNMNYYVPIKCNFIFLIVCNVKQYIYSVICRMKNKSRRIPYYQFLFQLCYCSLPFLKREIIFAHHLYIIFLN